MIALVDGGYAGEAPRGMRRGKLAGCGDQNLADTEDPEIHFVFSKPQAEWTFFQLIPTLPSVGKIDSGRSPGEMYPVITIADEMLKIAKRQGKSLTPLQLMKLVYIAHGWSLAMRGSDLFPERIEAWKYGPVVPDLYQATRHFGRNSIPFDKILSEPSRLDQATQTFLEDVFAKYGGLSGYQLSQLTHRPGTPWQQVYQDGIFGIEIPDDLIRCHYQELLDERQRRSSAG